MHNQIAKATSPIRLASGGAVLVSVLSSVLWLACGSDDTTTPTCVGDQCGATEGGPGDATDDQHVPDGCDLTKDPKDSAACVDDTIALFVSPAGSDANSGTKTAPLKTINAAIGKTDSQHTRVYVCAGAYNENVKVTTGTKTAGIYAGFSCSDWSYAGGAPNAVVTSTNGYALEVNNLNTTLTVEDVELDSPDAQTPGDSSIAVFITQSTGVILKRVNAKAGKGADGADAVATSNWDEDPDGGLLGGNNATGDVGGLAKNCSSVCKNGVGSLAGQGGLASENGQDGGPTLAANPAGSDGIGGVAPGCAAGPHPGAFAPAADAGASGAAQQSLTATGLSSSLAILGGTGGPGQGGGGGGGGSAAAMKGGGGGGGCGGCGGAGGGPGGSGGSSYGVLVYDSTMTVDSSSFTAANAGNGKSGGPGQAGQPGGTYGTQVLPGGTGCSGAPGGAGGAGAGGGGGAAGNSIALGYLGTPPTVTSTTFTKGSAGTPGGGGTGAAGNNGLAGAAGISAEQQDLKP